MSRDRSGRERSPEEQRADNQRAAAARNWKLGSAYKDVGSASRYASKNREEFDNLMVDLEKGRFSANILMLWESSRGSRKVSEWVRLIELCEEHKVCIFVTSDGKLYDPADARDRRSLLEDSVDAEYESAKVSKRAKRAQAANAAAGMPSGRIPYGYKRLYDPITRKLVAQEPEPAQAQVIKELFDRLHKGHSLRAIAADFEQRGVRTRSGIVFSAQHLRSLALNHTYVGQRVHDPDRHKVKTRLSPKATFTTAMWPPLVARATFLAVQRILTSPERVTVRPGRGVHLLSMIAVCDICGGPIAARSQKDRPEPEYHCHLSGHFRAPYAALNDLAEAAMLAYLTRADNWAKLGADPRIDERLAAARDEVMVVQAELDELADLVGRGLLSATLAARAEPGIVKRLEAARLAEAQIAAPNRLAGLLQPGADMTLRWQQMPMSAKREVARLLLTQEVLGQLRVKRSTSRGHRRPISERVVWQRA